MNNESGGKILSNRRYGKVLLGMFLVGIMMCFFYKDASAFGNLLKSSELTIHIYLTIMEKTIAGKKINSYFHISLTLPIEMRNVQH